MRVLFKLRRREQRSDKLLETLVFCSWLIGALVALWLIYKVPWINDLLGTDPRTIKHRVGYVMCPLVLVLYPVTKLRR